MKTKNKNLGFTLIELLVVVAIIGLISSIVFASLSMARKKSRDARRLSDMKQIQTALEFYYDKYNRYPDISNDACCDGFDQGPCQGDPTFIGALVLEGFLPTPVADPSGGFGTGCYGYNYYRYSSGYSGCDSLRGNFYVLGVRDMETSGNPHPQSPGWSCTGRNWQDEFDWVTGRFEK
ncbi:MAG: type II secretion system protein [Patescibacteria group bacterium]